MTPELAYEWLAPKLDLSERKVLDVIYQQLAAEKAARKKVEVESAQWEEDALLYCQNKEYLQQLAETAVSNLKELSEQEPVLGDYIYCPEYDDTTMPIVDVGGAYIPANMEEVRQGLSCKLYAAPIPTPEVADLLQQARKEENEACASVLELAIHNLDKTAFELYADAILKCAAAIRARMK